MLCHRRPCFCRRCGHKLSIHTPPAIGLLIGLLMKRGIGWHPVLRFVKEAWFSGQQPTSLLLPRWPTGITRLLLQVGGGVNHFARRAVSLLLQSGKYDHSPHVVGSCLQAALLPAGPNPRSQLQGAVVVAAAHLTFLRTMVCRLFCQKAWMLTRKKPQRKEMKEMNQQPVVF